MTTTQALLSWEITVRKMITQIILTLRHIYKSMNINKRSKIIITIINKNKQGKE